MHSVKSLFLILVIAVPTAAVVVFSFQNTQMVELSFFRWGGTYPLFLIMLLACGAGLIIALAATFWRIIRLRNRLRKANKDKGLLEKEIAALRNQPLFDEPPASSPAPPEGPVEEEQPLPQKSLS